MQRLKQQGWLRLSDKGWALLIPVTSGSNPNQIGWICVMALFLSTFEKNIDKKGRVSVPATFRGALSGQHFNGVIVYASFIHSCIEACGMDRIEKLNDQIENLDPFSEERDAFATAILGGSQQLSFDGEGRVSLPEQLMKDAGIENACVFVGKGATFEIWEPKAFAAYEAESRRLAKEKRLALRGGQA